jgi:3-hydroxyisobutyrate dehydrogenase-like beta-hydroxyacid dehydrogenase
LDVLQVVSEMIAAQQPWAAQGVVVAPATVSVLPSQDVLFTYVNAGKDMEAVFEVRPAEGT